MEDELPQNLQQFWVFDYEGKLSQHKQTVSKQQQIFKLAQQILKYTKLVLSDTLKRISITDGKMEWLITLDNKRIIVMKKRLAS